MSWFDKHGLEDNTSADTVAVEFSDLKPSDAIHQRRCDLRSGFETRDEPHCP